MAKKIIKKPLLKNIVNQTNRRFLELIKANPQALDWYMSEARKWVNTLIENFNTESENIKEAKDFNIYYPGHFYCFSYESKGYVEGTLGWFDSFPFIFVLAKTNDYFLGINLHHLKVTSRLYVLKRLFNYFPEKFIEDQYLRPMNYDIFMRIMGNSHKDISCAIRLYRKDHLLKFHGMKVMRIKNMDVETGCLVSTPLLKGISPQAHKQWTNENTLNT